jgi:hypothetical protein
VSTTGDLHPVTEFKTGLATRDSENSAKNILLSELESKKMINMGENSRIFGKNI